MRTALYPGTFDPVTNGHRDIIRRAMGLVDRLVIAVAVNADKAPLFTLEERVDMITKTAEALESGGCEISVVPFENLLVDCARENGAGLLIRGLRAVSDFEFEYQMVGMNRNLDPEIETVFLMADSEYQAIASRLVKEVARLGGNVSSFVAPHVEKALIERFARS